MGKSTKKCLTGNVRFMIFTFTPRFLLSTMKNGIKYHLMTADTRSSTVVTDVTTFNNISLSNSEVNINLLRNKKRPAGILSPTITADAATLTGRNASVKQLLQNVNNYIFQCSACVK